MMKNMLDEKWFTNSLLSVFSLALLVLVTTLSCKKEYKPKFDIDKLIQILETSDEDLDEEIAKIDTGWNKLTESKNPGSTFTNGSLIISKANDRELVFIDGSKTNHNFLDYIRSLNSNPTKEENIYFFTYKSTYLVYYNDKTSPVDIMVTKVVY